MINVIYTILPVISMIIGFYFGYRLGKDKEIPQIEIKSPVEIVEDIIEKHEAKELNNELEDFMTNLDNYPNNQKKIKWGK